MYNAFVKKQENDIKSLSYLNMDKINVYFHNNFGEEHSIYTPECGDEEEVDQIVLEYENGVRLSLDTVFLNIN